MANSASAELYDFSSYGLDWKLTDSMTEMPQSFVDALWNVRNESESELHFSSPDGTTKALLQTGELLGAGTYGKVYRASDATKPSVNLVVKVIDLDLLSAINTPASRVQFLYDICIEVLIQMLVYDTTKDIRLPKLGMVGPFTPKIHYFGIGPTNAYIVSDYISGKFDSAFSSKQPAAVIALGVFQTCKILDVLFKKLAFSHRDLKADNMMYEVIDGQLNIRLIDFGFSCVKLNGGKLPLHALHSSSSHLHYSQSITRDMHSLLYMLSYRSPLNASSHIVKIMKAIIASDIETPASWRNSYSSFNYHNNRDDLKPQNITFDIIMNVFYHIDGPTWASHLTRLYERTIEFLTDGELEQVPAPVFEAYLVTKLDFRSDDLLFYLAKNPMRYALYNLIISRYVRPEITNAVNILGNTALITGCDRLNLDFVAALLPVPNCKTAIQNKEGNTALHRVIIKSNLLADTNEEEITKGLGIIKLLLDMNPYLLDIKNGRKIAAIDAGFVLKDLFKHFINSYRTNLSLVRKRRTNTNLQKGAGLRKPKRKTYRLFKKS